LVQTDFRVFQKLDLFRGFQRLRFAGFQFKGLLFVVGLLQVQFFLEFSVLREQREEFFLLLVKSGLQGAGFQAAFV
ncbi:MAG: hypothetical protein ACK56F_11530, partial [bacterium]